MLKLWENVQNIGEISVSKAALPMQNRLHSLYLSNILKHGYRSHMTTSKHGIKIYQDGKEKNSCIILGTGAGTGIYDHSSVVAAGQLLVWKSILLLFLIIWFISDQYFMILIGNGFAIKIDLILCVVKICKCYMIGV
jgi:hypothetical protein